MPMSRLIVPIMIFLAIVGFATILITDPFQLLKTMLIFALVIGGVYLVYRLFFRRKTRGTESGYERAVKQSKERQKQKQRMRSRASHLKVIGSSKQNRRKQRVLKKQTKPTFTVIEGKKNKKKNRALF